MRVLWNFSILNPGSRTEVPLLHNEKAGWIFQPRYSPEGKEIVASWNRGELGVYVLTLQGSLVNNERPHRLVAGKPPFGFGTIGQSANAAPYRGKEFKLTAHVKTALTGEGNAGQCWTRVDRSNKQRGFFENMDSRPIVSASWGRFEIAGKIDSDAELIVFGCGLKGLGEIWVDQLQLLFKDSANAWMPIEIKNPGFESDGIGGPPSAWGASSPGYTYHVRSEDPFSGQKSLRISAIPVSPNPYSPVAWSADGKSIFAFDREKNEIVTVPATAGIATSHVKLTDGQMVGDITITPDGRRVVYTVEERRSDIWIVENFDPSVR